MKQFVFRCDGGGSVGYGHLTRCVALADQLRIRHQIESTFIMDWDRKGIEYIHRCGYPTSFYWDALHEATTLILDVRSHTPVQILDYCREQSIRIVTIDDPSERRLQADLAFYPPVEVDTTGAVGQFYIGWEYILLRDIFNQEYPSPPRERPSILVSMGYHTDAVAQALHRFNVTTVSGFEVENMAELMARTDLAVAQFGTIAYELARMGVPALLASATLDHLKSAEALFELGMAESLGIELTFEKIVTAVERLLDSPEQLALMSWFGREIIDGQGAVRVADILS